MITISSDLARFRLTPNDLINVKGDLQVGFFETAKYPNGAYVATIARVNEYGTSRIPMRPFFRNAINGNQKKWIGSFKSFVKQNRSNALDLLGEVVRGDIVNSITTLDTPPNAQSTIDKKGSSNPLIDTSLMRRSVTYKVVK